MAAAASDKLAAPTGWPPYVCRYARRGRPARAGVVPRQGAKFRAAKTRCDYPKLARWLAYLALDTQRLHYSLQAGGEAIMVPIHQAGLFFPSTIGLVSAGRMLLRKRLCRT